jgi:hypothetical protein
MSRRIRRADRDPLHALLFAILATTAWTGAVHATPSSTCWTNATTDVQGFRVLHIGVDNYFTVFRKGADGAGDFPTDVGLTVGVLPYSRLQMEIGIDSFEPSDHPLFFNAKIGTPEGALFPGAPALSVGVFNLGTKPGVTNQNIADAVVGKTLPGIGRVFAGGYLGNEDVLRDPQGGAEAAGFMLGFDRGFAPVQGSNGSSWNRWVLAADYASGSNAVAGGSVGLYYYFASNVSLLAGPVWFNEPTINGEWKWTLQLDANVPF